MALLSVLDKIILDFKFIKIIISTLDKLQTRLRFVTNRTAHQQTGTNF